MHEGSASFRFDPCNKFLLIGRDFRPTATEVCAVTDPVPDLSHLARIDADCVARVIENFPDVLTPKLGLTHLLEYDIQLADPTPVKLSPYRLMPRKMAVLREKIKSLLDQGIIRPSTSQYSSPIFLVPKGDNDFRPVVDFRALNQKIKIESVPLPDIYSCFHSFREARFFTSLDLNSAYHQIGLSERSKPFTAFATGWNLYEYTRVPFGIATGAQVLTRLLDIVFSDIKFRFV
jgi:hypothetical protein